MKHYENYILKLRSFFSCVRLADPCDPQADMCKRTCMVSERGIDGKCVDGKCQCSGQPPNMH